MKKRLFAVCLTIAASYPGPAAAQNPVVGPGRARRPSSADTLAVQKSPGSLPQATQACSYSYTIGTSAIPNDYLNYCITVNGNFANFQSPYGVELLDQDGAYEGYGICDDSNGNQYYDYAHTDSGNWDAPVLVTHTATEVKITRTTSDGAWTLTQTISREVGPPPYAKITMALKNNSGVTKAVFLERFAEFAPDQAAATSNWQENYDGSQNSAWGYIPTTPNYSTTSGPYGMMLQNIGLPTPTSVPYDYAGFVTENAAGPAPCDPGANNVGTLTNSDGAGVMVYVFDLNKEQTVTVNSRYMPF